MKELLKYRCFINNEIKDVFYFYELPTNKDMIFVCTNLDDNKGHFIPKEQLMMSTGKYDSNGKLIFEGDIVTTKFNGLDSKVSFLVVWNDKEALFDGKILKRLDRQNSLSMGIPNIIILNRQKRLVKNNMVLNSIFRLKNLLKKDQRK